MMLRLQLPQMMTRVVVSDDDRIVAVIRCILLCLVIVGVEMCLCQPRNAARHAPPTQCGGAPPGWHQTPAASWDSSG